MILGKSIKLTTHENLISCSTPQYYLSFFKMEVVILHLFCKHIVKKQCFVLNYFEILAIDRS